jgi:hypothetical protein
MVFFACERIEPGRLRARSVEPKRFSPSPPPSDRTSRGADRSTDKSSAYLKREERYANREAIAVWIIFQR